MHENALVRHLVESMTKTELGLKGRFRESMRDEFARLGVQRILEGPAGSQVDERPGETALDGSGEASQ